MKTYCDSNGGSQIEPVLWNARESVWIISPWLGKDYAEELVSLSQKGIEVKIITSYVDLNIESIEILKARAHNLDT
jgi:phosphatidylserine/phosphatidylglycerophosphate/cardiolipin synthase-like enzyme